MSEYYHSDTKTVKAWSDIVSENPNTSFPAIPVDGIAKSFGCEPLTDGTVPNVTSELKVIASDGIAKDASGKWIRKWKLVDRHSTFKDSDGKTVTKKTQDDAYLKSIDDNIASANRIRRNQMLADTDHHGLSDITMSAKVKTYRKSLRDLPTHSNWPNLDSDDWPSLS